MKFNDWPEIAIANKDADGAVAGFNVAFKIVGVAAIGMVLYAGVSALYSHIVTAFSAYFGG